MAWQVSKRVWDSTRIRDKKDKDKFKPAHRLVLLALADIADEQGICWPKFDTSYQTLADMAGIERRSAIRVIDDLIKAGYLFKNDTVGRGHSNIYAVLIGLSEPEKEKALALISDLGVTISDKEKVSPKTPIKEELVTWESPPSDLGVTISGLNGDLGVTQPYLKNPSIPNKSSKDDSGKKPLPPAEEKPKGPKTLVKDAFLESSKLPWPGLKKEQSFWWGQFGEIARIFGDDSDKAVKATQSVIEYMKNHGLSIVGPKSIVNLCRQVAGGQPLSNGRDSPGNQGIVTVKIEGSSKKGYDV